MPKLMSPQKLDFLALTLQSKKVFQMDGPNLEGTLKVTGAKTMFLLA